jgi:hypothetical protein
MTETVNDRLAALTAIRQLLPDADTAQTMAIATWATSGSIPLDPGALNVAAERLAETRGVDWRDIQESNRCRGMAAEVLRAYSEAAHRP